MKLPEPEYRMNTTGMTSDNIYVRQLEADAEYWRMLAQELATVTHCPDGMAMQAVERVKKVINTRRGGVRV